MIQEEYLKSIIGHVAKHLNLKSWIYTQNKMNEAIENYFGVLIPITIIATDKNRQNQIPVFVKIPPKERTEYLKSIIRQHYEVEIYTYTTLLPIYKNILNVETNQLIPESYYASLERNNEVLVLKDMTADGYTTYKGKLTLDIEHIVVSLKALAKFHSLSIILKEKSVGFDEEIMKPYTYLHPVLYFNYIENSIESHIDLFKASKYETYFHTLVKDFDSFISCSISKAKYIIYGHGDFWKENILFKYENAKPIGACVIDFQKSRKMSPAQDVLTFLLGNVEANVRREHHQYFLDIYIRELHRHLKENGLSNIYSIEDLHQDMTAVAPLSLAISTMSYSLWLGLENGDTLKSKNVCDNEYKNVKLDSFKTLVINMFEYLLHFGYITI